MNNFHASVVERRITVTKDFASHPMEAGWALEAIFFLVVEEVSGVQTSLDVDVEISADGINWIPEGTVFPTIRSEGHYAVRVSHFGNWLRVHGKMGGANPLFKLSVHLHLKG